MANIRRQGDLAISNSEVTLPTTSSGSNNPYYKRVMTSKTYKKDTMDKSE
ncbi:MAG: hypothetical protein CM15mP88_1780 [Pseudomonadota bacterium]|nr:MAG: hypothetical protein CM15mP88_1780 [Pseudomonadota bacterium]